MPDCHLSPSQAMQYMELIPKEMQPVAGTDGAYYRRRQLVRQLPVHDHDPSQCRGLAEGEAKLMEDFVKKYKAEALGVGEVALPGQAGNAKEEGKAKDASSAAEKPPETTNGALESTPTVGLYVSPAWRDGCFWGVQSQLENQCQRGAHGNCPCLIGCSAPTCPSAGTPMQSR